MVLALSDSWAQLITILVSALLPVLAFGGKMLLEWLKTQKWVQKAHLETVFAGLVPLVLQWVESWAGMQDEKPTGEAKMAKFKELFNANLPKGTTVPDEELTLRAEVALKTLNGDK